MHNLPRSLSLFALLLLGALWLGSTPAQAQCAQGLLANCPAAVGLSLTDKLWADQASLTPHTARAATPGQILALAPQVYPMLGGITISGLCSGTGTNAIPLTACNLPGSAVTSGTIASARLPLPGLGVGGVVQSYTAPTGQFVTGITTAGAVTSAAITSALISDASPLAAIDVSNALGTGAAPVISACGTGAIVAGSTDYSGSVTGMSGSTCTATYASPGHTPKLNCNLTATTGVAMGVVTTTAAMVASGTVTGFAWNCF